MQKLTVVIPVYNTAPYLARCLDSITGQIYKNLEIICVDDGSTDHSLNILRDYEKRDTRIRILSQLNQGLSAARNNGMALASGDYITFVDSDDTVEREAYHVAMALFALDVDAVCFGTKIVRENKKTIISPSDEFYYSIHHENVVEPGHDVLMEENVSCCNKIFKLALIRKYGVSFPEGRHYEDAEFYWKYMVNASNIYFLKNRYYNYLRRDGSIMHSTFLGSEKAIDHLHIVFSLFSYFSSDKKYSCYLRKTWPVLFEKYFHLSYKHSVETNKKIVVEQARYFIAENRLTDLYPDNAFIGNLEDEKKCVYPDNADLSIWKKMYFIYKTEYRKYIHILGFRISVKRKRYKKFLARKIENDSF